jgi:hypothetical protein
MIRDSNIDLRKRKVDITPNWKINPATLRFNRAMEIKTGYTRDRKTSQDIYNGVY